MAIAVKYKDELFELSNHKAHFRWFGIADAKVQQNLFIVLEPQLFDPQVGMWGVHPDQSRNRLIFTGNGDKGAAIPMADWGNEFSDGMPEEIREAILKARGEGQTRSRTRSIGNDCRISLAAGGPRHSWFRGGSGQMTKR
jgi:hypothetical protein